MSMRCDILVSLCEKLDLIDWIFFVPLPEVVKLDSLHCWNDESGLNHGK